jgi:hypothetical protein
MFLHMDRHENPQAALELLILTTLAAGQPW